jgi:hypothetical protein
VACPRGCGDAGRREPRRWRAAPGRHSPAVVAHHATDAYAPRLQRCDGAPQKRRTGSAELVRQDFDIRHAAVIIDGHVHVLPANARRGPSAIAVDPVADLADASQRFDIDVEEVARAGPLVALYRDRGHGRQ